MQTNSNKTKRHWLMASLTAGVLMAPLASLGTTVEAASLPTTPSIVSHTARVCLVNAGGSMTGFGSTSKGECADGMAKVTIWQMSPRYPGSPVLIEASATRMTPRSMNAQGFPIGSYYQEGFTRLPHFVAHPNIQGSYALDLSVSGGTLQAVPHGLGARYSVANHQVSSTGSVAGSTTQFYLDQSASTAQTLTAIPGLVPNGPSIHLVPPMEPHPNGQHGSGLGQTWQVVEWIPPAQGGTITWSFDGSTAPSIHVGRSTQLPTGWKVTQTGNIGASPTIGASYAYGGNTSISAGQQLLAQSHTTGNVTITPRGGAQVSPDGTHGLTLNGTIGTWANPQVGQSVSVVDHYAGSVTYSGLSASSHWRDPIPTDEQRGSLSPTDGLTVSLTHLSTNPPGHRRTVTVTPTGVVTLTESLVVHAGHAYPQHWIPVTVHATKNGKPWSGMATVKISRGPKGAMLQREMIAVKNGVGQDAVMASTAGVIIVQATMQDVHAVGTAHVMAHPFPWWILLLLLVAAALMAYLIKRHQAGEKPSGDGSNENLSRLDE